MGLITKALTGFLPRVQDPKATDDHYLLRTLEGFMVESGMGDAGVPVTANTTIGLAAVFACCRVVSEDVAMLPLDLFERVSDSRRKKALDNPLWDLLHYQPNDWQTSAEFREQMMWSCSLWNDAFAEIKYNRRGYPKALIPFQPEHVRTEQLNNRRLSYEVAEPGRETRILTQREMFHLRGPSRTGINGLRMFSEQRQPWGLALAEGKYGANLYRRGASHSGILSHPGSLGEEAKTRLGEGFENKFGGTENAGKTVVLEEGVKYYPISMKATDAEWINSRKFSVIEVCRGFRMQPHKIQSLDNATFTNIEHQAIEHVQDTLMPWLVRWEQAIQRDIIQDRRFYVEFNVDALLRGDMKTRYESYNKATGGPWMLRNEARRKENMEPIDGFDEPLDPLNMQGPANNQSSEVPVAGTIEGETVKRVNGAV